jgi:hypothetical protein
MTCLATSVEDETPTPPPDIAHHLEELLASEKVSDVTFLVEEKEIRAHKLVIAPALALRHGDLLVHLEPHEDHLHSRSPRFDADTLEDKGQDQRFSE